MPANKRKYLENEPFVYVRIKEVQRQKGKRDGSTTVAHKKSPSFAPLHTVSGNSRRKARIKNRKKKKIGYNHLGMFGISLIVLILLSALMFQSRLLRDSLAGYETQAESLNQQIEEEKARTQEIEDLKDYMLTDEYVEQAAREKLGLVKENEIIFQEEK